MNLAPVVLAHEAPFMLGALRVLPAECQLLDGGRAIHVEPRVMQLLVALARAGGDVVSRDDLIACCWEGRHVGDDAINRAVAILRRHGRRDGGGGFAVETITKVGHRLVLSDKVPRSRVPAVAIIAAIATAIAVGAVAVDSIIPQPPTATR